MISEQFPALIVVTPLILSFFIPVVGWWNRKLCLPIVLIALSVCLVSAFGILDTVIKHGTVHYRLGNWEPPWGIEYVIDHLNAYVAIIVSCIALLVAIYSKKSVEQELPEHKIPQFYTLFLLNITGLLGITVTGDVFNLYVLLEIASFSAYGLVAIGEEGALVASFRYVIMGTIGACLYLLGVGYLYIVTGSLNMADLAQLLPHLYHSKVVLVAFAFFMVGIAIKMALFPLHVWLPDAYTHAPSAVSAAIAATMTKVGAYVMIRIMFTVFKPYFSIETIPATTILGWVAVAAMIFGSILAIAQSDLKRMFCYILLAEVGYIVMGISLANRMGLTGAILHILNDAFMMACLFLVAGAIMYKMGTRDIRNFRYLHRKMPFTMAAFTIAALSVIGIPPTCGFFSKWYLILGAIYGGQWMFAVVLVLSSLLSAVVFFRVIEKVYFEPTVDIHNGESHEMVEVVRDEAPLSMLLPIFITVAGIMLLGIFSGKIISTVIQFAIPAGF
ncbi:MAG: monovalent cation/H+ antiporter subunit D family protein [Syntrophales bacterium]|nr:monovalent cation/H+ antiporter subunit D family protein [Syntrophales bacterium]